MMSLEVFFTSNADASTHIAPIPRDAFTPIVESFALSLSGTRAEGDVIRMSVEGAFLDGSDEVISFAAVDAGTREVMGTITRSAYSVSGAVTDMWERHLVRSER